MRQGRVQVFFQGANLGKKGVEGGRECEKSRSIDLFVDYMCTARVVAGSKELGL